MSEEKIKLVVLCELNNYRKINVNLLFFKNLLCLCDFMVTFKDECDKLFVSYCGV